MKERSHLRCLETCRTYGSCLSVFKDRRSTVSVVQLVVHLTPQYGFSANPAKQLISSLLMSPTFRDDIMFVCE